MGRRCWPNRQTRTDIKGLVTLTGQHPLLCYAPVVQRLSDRKRPGKATLGCSAGNGNQGFGITVIPVPVGDQNHVCIRHLFRCHRNVKAPLEIGAFKPLDSIGKVGVDVHHRP